LVKFSYRSLVVVGLLSILLTACGTSSTKETATATSTNVKTETNNKQNDEDVKKKAEEEAKKKVEQEAAAKAKAEEDAKNPKWNTKDMYIESNSNIPLAIKLLKVNGDITKTAEAPAPISVQKAPWDYYGKPLKVTGKVAVVQDFPPGSEQVTAMGGKACEIVLIANDGAIIDSMLSVSSGDVKIGDSVTIFGYAVGLVEAPNKLGGKTTEVAVIGNTYGKN
jgi:hypothetical protein